MTVLVVPSLVQLEEVLDSDLRNVEMTIKESYGELLVAGADLLEKLVLK